MLLYVDGVNAKKGERVVEQGCVERREGFFIEGKLRRNIGERFELFNNNNNIIIW